MLVCIWSLLYFIGDRSDRFGVSVFFISRLRIDLVLYEFAGCWRIFTCVWVGGCVHLNYAEAGYVLIMLDILWMFHFKLIKSTLYRKKYLVIAWFIFLVCCAHLLKWLPTYHLSWGKSLLFEKENISPEFHVVLGVLSLFILCVPCTTKLSYPAQR